MATLMSNSLMLSSSTLGQKPPSMWGNLAARLSSMVCFSMPSTIRLIILFSLEIIHQSRNGDLTFSTGNMNGSTVRNKSTISVSHLKVQ